MPEDGDMKLFSSFRDSAVRDRHAWPLLVMICVTMIGSGMMAPVLSLYAATFGVTSTLVGMLVTIFGIGRLFANFPSGYLSQSFGRRPLLILGPLIIATGCIGAALTTDFTHLLVWRFVQGLGSGMYMTVSIAALADMGDSSSRARLIGRYQAALQFGATIGPAFGGFVAERFGLAAPFWALLALSLATALLGVFSYRDRTTPIATLSGAFGAKRGLFTLPFISISLVSGVSFFTRTACLFQLMPLIGHDDFKLDVGAIGVGVTISAGAILFVLPLSTRLIERMGARWAVIASMFASALGVALLVAGSHPFWFWASMVVYGLAGGFNGPAIGAYTMECLRRSQYGAGMGMQRTISDVGYVIGPVAVGLAADRTPFGNTAGVWLTVALIVLSTILFAISSAVSQSRRA
jgi:DHA1 family multidrug resistance protein-like MFS transporter